MTALNVIQTDDAIHFFTDGGSYAASNGQFVLAGYASKVALAPNGRFAIGFSGPEFLQVATTVLSEYPTISDAVAVAPEIINGLIQLNAQNSATAMTIIIGGFDDSGSRQVWQWVFVPGKTSAIKFSRLETDQLKPPIDFERIRNAASTIGGFDSIYDLGLAVLEEQRRTNFQGVEAGYANVSGHIVGLYAQATTVRFNEMTTRILKRWPDTIGQPINPISSSGAQFTDFMRDVVQKRWPELRQPLATVPFTKFMVDVAGATALDTGTAGALKPTTSVGSDLTAAHTAATTSGNTVSASQGDGTGTAGWYAFDNGANASNFWQTTSGTTGWLQYLFGSAQTAYGYSVKSRSGFPDRAPKTWTFEGSNNGSSWTTLDTQTNVTSWTGGDTKSYTIASPASYTYYRLNVSANNAGSLLLVEEMTINGAGSTNNLTVASTSIALASVPATVIPVIRIKHVDTAAAGTDYNLYVSRDGGTTYSGAASLTNWATDPFETDVHIVYGAPVDVSGQPSGSNVRIKIITLNNKSLEVRDWGAIAFV